ATDRFFGVMGEAQYGTGVRGQSFGGYGVAAASDNGTGIYARGGKLAAHFDGDIEMNGDVHAAGNIRIDRDLILSNADCAEDFDFNPAYSVIPGMVMVVDRNGWLTPATNPYDKRVLGVISGAGCYRPGIVLDRHSGRRNRGPIALLGKV